MSDEILMRDVPLSWDCPYCGAPAARYGYVTTLKASQCKRTCPKGPTPKRTKRSRNARDTG